METTELVPSQETTDLLLGKWSENEEHEKVWLKDLLYMYKDYIFNEMCNDYNYDYSELKKSTFDETMIEIEKLDDQCVKYEISELIDFYREYNTSC